MTDRGSPDTTEARTVGPDAVLAMYERMVTIRRFEEAVSDIYKKGEIPGFTHLYMGQEAVAVGVCSALRNDDYITSTHRGHGHVIAKGADLDRMMAELFARETGYCHGKGGSMHIADTEIGILGANGIVGAGMPIAVGAAYSATLRGTDQVAASFFGDGAVTEGAFHEAVNLASAWELPVLFVFERNDFAVGTRFERVSKLHDVDKIGAAYGLRSAAVDGNDVRAVHAAAADAVAAARRGEGPTILACSTFRLRAHFEGDHTRYLADGELDAWRQRDPITRCRAVLRDELGVADDALERIDDDVQGRIDAAIAYARSAPEPSVASALQDVYA